MSARQLSNNGVPIPRYFTPLLHVQLSIFTCLGCMATETYWNYILYISYGLWELTTAWSESSSSTTHQKNCILHPLWRSQACERFKMADIPTQLANSCWLKYWSRRPGELIFRTFCSCSTIKAHFCHLKKLLEIYTKHIRRINGFMLQMHQTYHDAVFFGHTHTKHLQLWF